MAAIRLVTLDVTNTLIKVVGSPGHQYARAAAIYGIDTNENDMNKVFKANYKQYCIDYPNFGKAVGISSYKWWTDMVKKCFTDIGVTNQEETLTQISNHLYLHFTTAKAWNVLPRAEHALLELKSSGLKLGVISNFDERLNKILRNVGLWHFFDFVLPSYTVGFEKPKKQIFNAALKIAQVNPEEALHVGDNVERDYIGATNAGFQAALLSKGGNSIEIVDPKFIVQDLDELVDHIIRRLPQK